MEINDDNNMIALNSTEEKTEQFENLQKIFKYNRDELINLRDSPASKIKPKKSSNNKAITYIFQLTQKSSIQPSILPAFARKNTKNNEQFRENNLEITNRRQQRPLIQNLLRPSNSETLTKTKFASGADKSNKIRLSLSLNKEVKLNECKNAWRPSHLKKAAASTNLAAAAAASAGSSLGPLATSTDSSKLEAEETQELYRKVRGILNKLTDENFEKLLEEIFQLQIDTFEKVNGVMMLVFEKAIDEPNFCISYARLCKRLGDIKIKKTPKDEQRNQKMNFRSALLNKTELEFKNNVLNTEAKEKKLQPLMEKLQNPTNSQEQIAELRAIYEDEERKYRRRLTGTVCFIGELFKHSMLTGNIINTCILNLLDEKSEDKLECLCKLLTIVGEIFENTINNRDPKKRQYNLDAVMSKIQIIIDRKTQYNISNRIRFMLLDIIDFRRNNWTSNWKQSAVSPGGISPTKSNDEFPIQKDQMMKLNDDNISSSSMKIRNNNNSNNKNHNIRRHKSKENLQQQSTRKDYNNWQTQLNRKNKSLDPSKLGTMLLNGSTNVNSETKLGNSSQFAWTRFTSSGSNNGTTSGISKSQPIISSLPSTTMGTTPSTSSSSKLTNSFAALSLIDSNKENNKNPLPMNTITKKDSPKKVTSSSDLRKDTKSISPKSDSSKSDSSKSDSSLKSENLHQKDNNFSSKTMGKTLDKQQSLELPIIKVTSESDLAPEKRTTTSTDPRKIDSSELKQQQFDPENSKENHAMRKALDDLIETAFDRNLNECIKIIQEFPTGIRWGFFWNIFCDYLHLHRIKSTDRKILSKTFCYLIENDHVSVDDFRKGYNEFCNIVTDIIIDVPNVWNYIFQFIGPFIYKNIVTINDLWNDTLKDCNQGKGFLKEFIQYCVHEIGPNYIRNLWKLSKLNWIDFFDDHLSEDQLSEFIKTNNFEFIENDNVKSLPCTQKGVKDVKDVKDIVERVKDFLRDNRNFDEITDYIDGNISLSDDDQRSDTNLNIEFIRYLTLALCDFAATDNSRKQFRLDLNCFQNICKPLFLRYINNREEYELVCLYAIQNLDYSLEHPAGFLNEIFSRLYHAEIISIESFLKWRYSTKEPRGKGVAVKSLNTFFNSIVNSIGPEENGSDDDDDDDESDSH